MVLPRVGLIALGQSSASDELDAVAGSISIPADVVRDGALDGISANESAALEPEPGEKPMVCKTQGNGEARVSFGKVLPLMQEAVTRVERQDVEVIAILCGVCW
jgi:hypothetical protein